MLDYSSRPAGMALRRMHTARVQAIEVATSHASQGLSEAESGQLQDGGGSSRARTPEELKSLEEAVRNNFLFVNMGELQRREVFEAFEKRFVQVGAGRAGAWVGTQETLV